MATVYSETPDNYYEIEASVISDLQKSKEVFLCAEKVLFYDTCSFQRHSNLAEKEKGILIQYFVKHGIAVFLTKCVLMELTGDQHRLKGQYVQFIKDLQHAGVSIVIFSEEYTYGILSDCFSAINIINGYLIWAVRMVKNPVSTITDTLEMNEKLKAEVLEGKNLKSSDIYHRFFSAVRRNKEHGDNLGEESISICTHILSHLPGVSDGKLCVLTDDKAAAGKIHSVVRKTNLQYRGSRIILFSTPKLVQHMFQEKAELSEDEMVNIISQGISGNVEVMGITPYDLEIDKNISLPCRTLVKRIMEPNEIQIVF